MELAGELARYGPRGRAKAITAAEARAYCRRLARGHYENFSVVTSLVPRHLRQHLANVYAYCRWADDLADEAAVGEAEELLAWWRGELEACYAGRVRHPVFIALAETLRDFELPREPLADLLIAFVRDQRQTRYETLADLLTYCEKSANPVGRIVLCLGRSASPDNVRLSDGICTGLQIANFCQDVRRDYLRGRIYLPRELYRQYGWDEDRFAEGRCNQSFRRLLAEMADFAAARFDEGEPLVRAVHSDIRPAVKLFLAGGRAILAAIRAAEYDVWSRRPTVSSLTKARLVAGAWWQRLAGR